MKDFYFIALGLLVSTQATVAQNVLSSDRIYGSFEAVPKEITADGKSYMAVFSSEYFEEYSNLTIAASPTEIVARIEVPNIDFSGIYIQQAIGGEAIIVSYFYWEELLNELSPSNISDIESFLRSSYMLRNDESLVEFTDLYGHRSFYGNYYSEFWNEEQYGKEYPNSYFYLTDEGNLMRVGVRYAINIDSSTATWEFDEEKTREYGYNMNKVCPIMTFIYQDVDNSFYPTANIYASQNIFNTDDSWEFVVADIAYEEIPSEDIWLDEYASEQIFYRIVYKIPVLTGYKILNQSGNLVAYCRIPYDMENDKFTFSTQGFSIMKINGNLYMTTFEYLSQDFESYYEYFYDGAEGFMEECTGLYIIDPSTSNVKAVSRIANRMTVSGKSNSSLNINVDTPVKNEVIMLTDMTGRTISKTPAVGTLTIDTGNLPTGTYNITLGEDGTVRENIKILIK